MMNGPTGGGKSLVGLAAASLWSQMTDAALDVTVLTQTKNLQVQYQEEFPTAESATGRNNWMCYEDTKLRASQCQLIGTDHGCPLLCDYRKQKDIARRAPIRAINYAFYGATNGLFDANIMIADEADYLGELLTQSMSVDLSALVNEYGLQIEQGFLDVKNLRNVLTELLEQSAVSEEREQAKRGIEVLSTKRYAIKGVGNFLVPCPEARVVQDFVRGPTLIMSATVFAPQFWIKAWNVPVGWVELPCLVPPHKRPIRLLNIKKINKDTTEKEWEKVVAALDKLIAARYNLKGVVHSVSGWLTDLILAKSQYKYLMFRASGEGRMKGIEAFKQADRGLLIGPNLLRGIDLPDDQCRYIIFPKLPYPSMGDPRIQEMLKIDEDRYQIETLSALVQGAGRGVRHANDSCEIFILDSGAGYLFSQTKEWLPQWFRDAIVWKGS